jgi:inosine-uridine nucleoside N-ribohydrolase
VPVCSSSAAFDARHHRQQTVWASAGWNVAADPDAAHVAWEVTWYSTPAMLPVQPGCMQAPLAGKVATAWVQR